MLEQVSSRLESGQTLQTQSTASKGTRTGSRVDQDRLMLMEVQYYVQLFVCALTAFNQRYPHSVHVRIRTCKLLRENCGLF